MTADIYAMTQEVNELQTRIAELSVALATVTDQRDSNRDIADSLFVELESNKAKLAIANPELAPYGLAAKQTLEALGLLPKVQARLVMGENIGQAAQFVFSGNADAGLLPRAYVLETPEQKKLYQNSWLVPESLHQPIIQTAVLLTRGQHNRAALAFMQYLQQPAAQGIIASHGYN